MSSRDKYGNYVNDAGVTIKVSTDKNGNDHIGFYDGPVYEEDNHKGQHININYEKKEWDASYHEENHEKPEDGSGTGSGGCFLTSACMKHMKQNFDDNCYELRTLRWFRDNYVSKDDIKHYYEVAPKIVKSIDLRCDSNMIYKQIYNNVVSVCVNLIEDKKYDDAYRTYRDAVLKLESNYCV